MELNEKLLAKAKEAKTLEELTILAKENNIELTEEEATAYFNQLHPKTGELSDDELDNVAGGACHAKDGRLVVACTHLCNNYRCKSMQQFPGNNFRQQFPRIFLDKSRHLAFNIKLMLS